SSPRAASQATSPAKAGDTSHLAHCQLVPERFPPIRQCNRLALSPTPGDFEPTSAVQRNILADYVGEHEGHPSGFGIAVPLRCQRIEHHVGNVSGLEPFHDPLLLIDW